MIQIFRENKLKIIIFVLVFLLFPNTLVESVELKDYELINFVPDKNTSPRNNYIKVLNLFNIIDEKVTRQENDFSNTNYFFSRKELTRVGNLLKISEEQIKKGDIKKGYNNLEIIIKGLRNAQLGLMHSRVAETRGIYLDADSIPATKKEISGLIKEIRDTNFNVIYPETFRRGYSIIPNPVAEVDSKFKNIKFDVLKYIVDEAHKNNLEVHPWIWTFRVKSPTFGDSFLKRYPNLIAKREIKTFEDREALFLSPASPEARKLVLKLFKYIAKNYQVDGFLLDYIRYDETLGNDTLTKKYFKKYYINKHKHEPPEIVSGEPVFVEFQLWRENQVTEMVKAIKREVSLIKPGISIGTAVFRYEREGRLLKMQDWRFWANNRLISYVCPMLYTDNTFDLNSWLDSETDNNSRKDFLFPSLGVHKFNTFDDIYPQKGLINKRNISGFNIFSLSFIEKKELNDLTKSIFAKQAVIPDKNPVLAVKITLMDVFQWLKRQMNIHQNINSNELKEFLSGLNKFIETLNYPSGRDYKKILKEIKLLELKANQFKKGGKFSSGFINEIYEPLNYSYSIIETSQRYSEKNIYPQTLPPIPVLPEANEIPSARVFKTTLFPLIDGYAESDFWDRIDPISPFYWNTGISRSEVETVVKLAHNNENLFILFENYEPDIRSNESKNGYIEIVLQLPGNKKLFKFNVDAEIKNSEYFQKSLSKSSVKFYKTKWVAEIQIPFKEINFYPEKGNYLKANFIRIRNREYNPVLQWVVSFKEIINPQRFGTLYF